MTLADVLEEAFLTYGAILLLVPAVLVAVVNREGGVATEEDVHDDSQGLHITFLVVYDRVSSESFIITRVALVNKLSFVGPIFE